MVVLESDREIERELDNIMYIYIYRAAFTAEKWRFPLKGQVHKKSSGESFLITATKTSSMAESLGT